MLKLATCLGDESGRVETYVGTTNVRLIGRRDWQPNRKRGRKIQHWILRSGWDTQWGECGRGWSVWAWVMTYNV